MKLIFDLKNLKYPYILKIPNTRCGDHSLFIKLKSLLIHSKFKLTS